MYNNSKKQKIVVVDDDTEIQDMVSAYFKPRNFEIICYIDADAALADSLLKGRDWDVLLTDFHFPNMLAVEFTQRIKKNLPNLPIILITPPELAETAVTAIKEGAYDFIVKPIHFPQLEIAVERAIKLNELKGDLSELREIVKSVSTHQCKVIGHSPKFLQAMDIAKRVATSNANIFITGESGAGKEVFAKFIHNESKSKKGGYIAINCSAIPENLLESELFGHAKGSFTGAHEKKIGLFEEAQDGTLFLDEIGDLSLPLQAKLLRVLQEKKIKRVGENQYRDINCRIISATHKNLADEVAAGRFREDLYFRLNVIPIAIPALRERPEDLLLLAEFFLKKFALENGSPARAFTPEAIKFLIANEWRGNVRELENTIERAVALCSSAKISLEDFMPNSVGLNSKAIFSADELANTFSLSFESSLPSLDQVIYSYIEFALKKNEGARDKTAKDIGIDRKTLYKRMRTDTKSNHLP